MQMQVWK